MNNNVSCTAAELSAALKGHFALSYATFGSDNDLLPTKSTVGEWKQEYKAKRNITSLSPVDYAPYVYDAIWVYAKAIIQLIKEGNTTYIFCDLNDETSQIATLKIGVPL